VVRRAAKHSAVIETRCGFREAVSIREAKAFARRHHITAILIEESPGSGALAGLLTNRDIPRRSGLDDRPVDEFMTPFERLHVSPPGIGEDEAERLMFEKRIERLPLVDEARRIRGLITLRDILFFRNRPFSTKDGKGRLLVGAAIGARGDFLERARALVEAEVDILCIDIAHAHSEVMDKAIAAARDSKRPPLRKRGDLRGRPVPRECGVNAIKVGVGRVAVAGPGSRPPPGFRSSRRSGSLLRRRR
jgi:IMP dehydrogenase